MFGWCNLKLRNTYWQTKILLLQGSGNDICNSTNYCTLSLLLAAHIGLIHYTLSGCSLLWTSVSVLSEPHTHQGTHQGCTEPMELWQMQGKSSPLPRAPVEKGNCWSSSIYVEKVTGWVNGFFRREIEFPAEMFLINQIVMPEQIWHTQFMQWWREERLLENLL